MGFLDKLWDETLAGPMPESGLGKLRKYDSLPAGGSGTASPISAPAAVLPHHHEGMAITRSITILRTNSNFKNFSVDAAPDSPSTPGTPSAPGTPGGEFKRFTRRKWSADAFDRAESRRF